MRRYPGQRSQTLTADQMVGVSPWVGRLRAKIGLLATSNSTVLITGPTGTGKELIAHAIHDQSARREGPLVVVDCASAGNGLFDSHLFGHRKGAFTGADHESIGCFRGADGGTVFLDEVGELGPELQTKLLRVLEDHVVVPLGGHEGFPVDVRVIAATNRDLQDAVHAGRFREDLYYRLQIVSLRTLELRRRAEDIEPLARHLLERLAADEGLPPRDLTPEAIGRLKTYHWPGNVRQLKNLLERAVLFGHDNPLGEDVIVEMLSDQPGFDHDIPLNGHSGSTTAIVTSETATEPLAASKGWPTMAVVEREHVLTTLKHTGYNLSAAARLLGWDRKHLHRKIRKHGIELPSVRPHDGTPQLEDESRPP